MARCNRNITMALFAKKKKTIDVPLLKRELLNLNICTNQHVYTEYVAECQKCLLFAQLKLCGFHTVIKHEQIVFIRLLCIDVKENGHSSCADDVCIICTLNKECLTRIIQCIDTGWRI